MGTVQTLNNTTYLNGRNNNINNLVMFDDNKNTMSLSTQYLNKYRNNNTTKIIIEKNEKEKMMPYLILNNSEWNNQSSKQHEISQNLTTSNNIYASNRFKSFPDSTFLNTPNLLLNNNYNNDISKFRVKKSTNSNKNNSADCSQQSSSAASSTKSNKKITTIHKHYYENNLPLSTVPLKILSSSSSGCSSNETTASSSNLLSIKNTNKAISPLLLSSSSTNSMVSSSAILSSGIGLDDMINTTSAAHNTTTTTTTSSSSSTSSTSSSANKSSNNKNNNNQNCDIDHESEEDNYDNFAINTSNKINDTFQHKQKSSTPSTSSISFGKNNKICYYRNEDYEDDYYEEEDDDKQSNKQRAQNRRRNSSNFYKTKSNSMYVEHLDKLIRNSTGGNLLNTSTTSNVATSYTNLNSNSNNEQTLSKSTTSKMKLSNFKLKKLKKTLSIKSQKQQQQDQENDSGIISDLFHKGSMTNLKLKLNNAKAIIKSSFSLFNLKQSSTNHNNNFSNNINNNQQKLITSSYASSNIIYSDISKPLNTTQQPVFPNPNSLIDTSQSSIYLSSHSSANNNRKLNVSLHQENDNKNYEKKEISENKLNENENNYNKNEQKIENNYNHIVKQQSTSNNSIINVKNNFERPIMNTFKSDIDSNRRYSLIQIKQQELQKQPHNINSSKNNTNDNTEQIFKSTINIIPNISSHHNEKDLSSNVDRLKAKFALNQNNNNIYSCKQPVRIINNLKRTTTFHNTLSDTTLSSEPYTSMSKLIEEKLIERRKQLLILNQNNNNNNINDNNDKNKILKTFKNEQDAKTASLLEKLSLNEKEKDLVIGLNNLKNSSLSAAKNETNKNLIQQYQQNDSRKNSINTHKHQKIVVQASTSDLLRCFATFVSQQCSHLVRESYFNDSQKYNSSRFDPRDTICWMRTADRALLLQGWEDIAFMNPVNVVFVYLLVRESLNPEEIKCSYDLQCNIMACCYLAFSYMGNEISYPLKPFLIEDNRDIFWQRICNLMSKLSHCMLKINQDQKFFTELFYELKSYSLISLNPKTDIALLTKSITTSFSKNSETPLIKPTMSTSSQNNNLITSKSDRAKLFNREKFPHSSLYSNKNLLLNTYGLNSTKNISNNSNNQVSHNMYATNEESAAMAYCI